MSAISRKAALQAVPNNRIGINTRKVVAKRYSLKDIEGQPIEQWEDIVERVVSHVAQAEKHPAKREEFYRVKEVISPSKILLDTNLIINLIGIKEDPVINGEATKFLIEKTKGKRVFLKYDTIKYDSENNLLCYLYLENKTFINAHLIKNGLVQVDSTMDFKYKQKFISLIKTI